MSSPAASSPSFGRSPGPASSVLADIAASPTPYHAVKRAAEVLLEANFIEVAVEDEIPSGTGGRFLCRGGSLIAWVQQSNHKGFTIVGAHTDSPNLRVKASPDHQSASVHQVGVEVYGSPLLNSWLDRGLGLAGRVTFRSASGLETHLVLDDRPLLVIPQLAIHLDREINREGLKLNAQKHLSPMWALASDETDDETDSNLLRRHLGGLLGIDFEKILSWDLMAFDTQPPAVVGRDADLVSSARIDNLLSTFSGIRAMVDLSPADDEQRQTPVLALYDHEEIGSESATGAAGVFFSTILERIASAQGATRTEYLTSLSRSLVVSADGAHATHPNYVDRHEPQHHIGLNAGVVIKRNANHRYATEGPGEALVVDVLSQAGVPLQWYIHRNDLPCGSTIGPLTAAQLGATTVDLGAPQLAMHSCRETAGLHDIESLTRGLLAIWNR